MKVAVGDRIVVESGHVGGHARHGRIVELRHADGSPPYVVRWDDSGSDVLYVPGSDVHVVTRTVVGATDGITLDDPAEPSARRRDPRGRRVKVWHIDVEVVEDGAATTARAVLHPTQDETWQARHGRSMRASSDADDPRVGDEIAVARALRHLADRLLGAASDTISSAEQRDVTLTR